MRNLLLVMFGMLTVVALSVSAPAMAAEKAPMAKATAMTMDGYVIDTACATANKDKMDEFVKTHGKECALAPACSKSGYNLYSEGKLWKFDAASSAKVHKFLKKADSKLHVKAEVKHEKGDKIKLVSIANAE